MRRSSLGCEKPGSIGGRAGEELIQSIPELDVHVLPVVQAGPADMLVIQREPQWLDEVKSGARGKAESTCCACIVGNLGGDKDEIEHRKEGYFGLEVG